MPKIMKKIYLLLGCSLLLQLPNNLTAQVLVTEDFGSATGTTPPVNWMNNDIAGGGNVWEFDNPGGRDLTLPISDPAAIFDSDNYGSDGIPENCALETPLFDASVTTNPIFLSFDQYFDAEYGGASYIEVWNGSTWVEVYSSFTTSADPDHMVIDITADLNGASDAQVRFRWEGDYSMYWIVDNILVEAVSCLPVTDLAIDNTGTDFFDLSWTINGTETSWDIEYGAPGFMPGTGNELGSESATTNPYTLNGLDPGMAYDIYVRANCGSEESYWTLVSGTTDCAPITNLPWSENFESMTELGFGYFQTCWSASEEMWFSDFTGSWEIGAPAYSGTNYMASYSWNVPDTLWTPEFQLTAGTNYEFKFYFAGESNASPGWNAEVLSLNTQTNTVNTIPTGTFITPTESVDNEFRSHLTCFTPATSGVYKFGLSIDSNGNPYFLQVDDFSLIERGAGAGTNGSANVCQTEGLVDLNGLIVKDDQIGSWTFSPNPSAIVNDSLFNPQYVPAGVLTVNYITEGCLQDTASAVITIYPPSSAGTDGSITACKNEPVDLLSGLGGTVNFGGNWYDPQNNLMASSQVTTGTFPGQFNYDYITGNGVCPDDTSGVVITVTNCNWLSVDENALEEMSIYPNPSAGLVFIESSFEEGVFQLEITDLNGRIVENGKNTVSAGTNTVNLDDVQKGTYFFKLSNEHAEKVYRIVIQ
jgi:hypothetical protein